jgi:hypothetical protein
MEPENKKNGARLIVCFDDRATKKNPITLENPNEADLKNLNEKGYGIFETANSFFATPEQLEELALQKNKEVVTKRNKEFLTCLNEIFSDLDVCNNKDDLPEEKRERRKTRLKEALNDYCPASMYVITKNGLQPRWWIEEENIDEATQQKYVNIVNGIIEWSKKNGAKGDPVKDVTRVLRKPGYYHQKSEPYLITEENGNGKKYTLDELKTYFWHEPEVKNHISSAERRSEASYNDIDSLDIRQVAIDAWKEKGNEASFDNEGHLIIGGILTATFVGRLGNGNYMATTSGDYPAKGNAVTYVAETLGIDTKEAFKWICKKYKLKGLSDTKIFIPAISHAELMSIKFPPARYIIEPFIEQGAVNMISAPSNTGKSWFLLFFARDIVSGTSVFDKFPTEKTNVMIVNEEDSASLIQDRLRLLSMTDTSLPIYYRIAQGSKLEADFIDSLIEEAQQKNVGVIMFDSLRSIHEAEENSSTEMQKVMDLLKKIARANITVVFTQHHKKKDGFGKNNDAEATRGSTAINGAVSGHMSLEEVKKEGETYIIVRHQKSKAGPKLEPFEIGMKVNEKESVSFYYRGEYDPKEKALLKAKTAILNQLNDREELMGRKDFVHLKAGGITAVKEATKSLDIEGKIHAIQRKNAEKLGLKVFGHGKSNEILYSLKKIGLDTLDELPPEDT